MDLARDRTLSPRDIAAACGVSESSVKRWIDAGRIPAARTGGGHRRVTLPDALRFVRARGLAVPHPEHLGFPDAPAGGAPAASALLDALVAGDRARVGGLVAGAYLAGTPLPALCDGPVREAAEALGERWHGDFADGVAAEHAGMALLAEALGFLGGLLPAVAAGAPVAVGGTLPDDLHVLPSQMASLVLADRGWATLNLGALLPVASLASAAAARGARLVWLSCAHPPGDDTVAQVGALSARLAEAGVPLVVGGRGRAPLVGLEGVTPVGSMAALVEVAGRLPEGA